MPLFQFWQNEIQIKPMQHSSLLGWVKERDLLYAMTPVARGMFFFFFFLLVKRGEFNRENMRPSSHTKKNAPTQLVIMTLSLHDAQFLHHGYLAVNTKEGRGGMLYL